MEKAYFDNDGDDGVNKMCVQSWCAHIIMHGTRPTVHGKRHMCCEATAPHELWGVFHFNLRRFRLNGSKIPHAR